MSEQSRQEAGCLSENEILSLFRGTLNSETSARARAHIDTCAECLELFTYIVQSSTNTLASGPRARGPSAELASGTALGRYRIREAIGAGAMGVVYLADDEELGRKVALKMLRTTDEAASKRLRREAQAIARIAHPNVIVVYEVGLFEEQVYMAMEFVDGTSLASWLTEERTLADILDVYLQAGRGLAVAHAAGLVHRDFKPDNVLVGRDGRVRVADFGLARAESVARSDGDSSDAPSSKPPLTTLTRTGAIVGTPAYMAPEQYDGRPADARTDQFAYCVALYEALYGVRPFEADSLEGLEEAVKGGQVRSPSQSGARARVLGVIRRGLAVSPEDRFASMDALLAELGRSRGRRPGLVLGGGAVVAVGLIAYAATSGSAGEGSVTVRMREVSAPATAIVSVVATASAVATASSAAEARPSTPRESTSSESAPRIVAPRGSTHRDPSPTPTTVETPNASDGGARDPLDRRR